MRSCCTARSSVCSSQMATRRTMAARVGADADVVDGEEAFHPFPASDRVSRPCKGAPIDLAVEALERVGRVVLGVVGFREAHVAKHIGPRLRTFDIDLTLPRWAGVQAASAVGAFPSFVGCGLGRPCLRPGPVCGRSCRGPDAAGGDCSRRDRYRERPAFPRWFRTRCGDFRPGSARRGGSGGGARRCRSIGAA